MCIFSPIPFFGASLGGSHLPQPAITERMIAVSKKLVLVFIWACEYCFKADLRKMWTHHLRFQCPTALISTTFAVYFSLKCFGRRRMKSKSQSKTSNSYFCWFLSSFFFFYTIVLCFCLNKNVIFGFTSVCWTSNVYYVLNFATLCYVYSMFSNYLGYFFLQLGKSWAAVTHHYSKLEERCQVCQLNRTT